MVDEDSETVGGDASKSAGPQSTGPSTILQRLGSPPRAYDIPRGACSQPHTP